MIGLERGGGRFSGKGGWLKESICCRKGYGDFGVGSAKRLEGLPAVYLRRWRIVDCGRLAITAAEVEVEKWMDD